MSDESKQSEALKKGLFGAASAMAKQVKALSKSGAEAASKAIEVSKGPAGEVAVSLAKTSGQLAAHSASKLAEVGISAWSWSQNVGAATLEKIGEAATSAKGLIFKECTVPLFLLPIGKGPREFLPVFDFHDAISNLNKMVFVRPKIEVWTGRQDLDREYLAELISIEFTRQLSEQRQLLLKSHGKNTGDEVKALEKFKETSAKSARDAGSLVVASLLFMFLVSNPVFDLIFLTLAVFSGADGISKALLYLRRSTELSSKGKDLKRQKEQLESELIMTDAKFRSAIDHLKISIHPKLEELVVFFNEVEGRLHPPIGKLSSHDRVPSVRKFLSDKDYLSKVPEWSHKTIEGIL